MSPTTRLPIKKTNRLDLSSLSQKHGYSITKSDLRPVILDHEKAYFPSEDTNGNGKIDRVAQTNATSTEYFLGDALGSVRKLTDAAGAVTLERSYDPYGQVSVSSGAGQSSYGFTGEFQDSYIKLIYLRSRFLSPETGRFLTKDTWHGDYNKPLSLNRWNYTESNPINFSDPTGYFSNDLITSSLGDKNINTTFGNERFGVARWGLFKLLQEAKDFDRISLYSLDFGSNEGFYPLKSYPGGSWMILSLNCELYFFQPGKASVKLPEFLNEVNAKSEENVMLSDRWWRSATLQYHWYGLNDAFYGDFYKGSHLPDFYFVSGGFEYLGKITLGYVHDRYGNQFYPISFGGAFGAGVAENWEGYSSTTYPTDRRFSTIPSEKRLKQIITGSSITLDISSGTAGIGYSFWNFGSSVLFGGRNAAVGGFGSYSFTWEASTKDYFKAWHWVDKNIPNFGPPSIH